MTVNRTSPNLSVYSKPANDFIHTVQASKPKLKHLMSDNLRMKYQKIEEACLFIHMDDEHAYL